jgi:acetyl-CoA carboxylase biotin carboxyl carrier protein
VSSPRPGRDAAPVRTLAADSAAADSAAAAAGVSGPADAAGARGDPAGDASLLALVDRLAGLLERSDLTELEVEAGGTGLILRKPAALAAVYGAPAALPADWGGRAGDPAGSEHPGAGSSRGAAADPGGQPGTAEAADVPAARLAVHAPLTGIFYASPGPGSPPFVQVGREVVVGQVIGLIEAMKLFNEIKSDQAGRVVRVIAEDGALVKAKQPLIEVEPL